MNPGDRDPDETTTGTNPPAAAAAGKGVPRTTFPVTLDLAKLPLAARPWALMWLHGHLSRDQALIGMDSATRTAYREALEVALERRADGR